MIGWLEADWPAPVGVRVISTYRTGGVSQGTYSSLNLGDHVGDALADVLENRRRLQASASLPAEPLWLTQVHGTEVLDAGAVTGGPADASFTREPGQVLAILTADCVPVMLTSDTGEVIAAAHAGWRGLAAGVLERTLQAMNVPAERLMAWIGPAIGPGHFEVGAEVREAFASQDPGAEGAFHPNARGRFMADLYVLVRRRLNRLGVSKIFGGGLCTHADPARFFSHRRDGITGRQATLIWRENR